MSAKSRAAWRQIFAPGEGARAVLPRGFEGEEVLAGHLPYAAVISNRHLMTREGDILASLLVSGVDSYVADARDVTLAAQALARSVGALGEEFGIYVHALTVPMEVALRPVAVGGFALLSLRLADVRQNRVVERAEALAGLVTGAGFTADITTDVILLTGEAPPAAFNFLVETPSGALITPAVAAATPPR